LPRHTYLSPGRRCTPPQRALPLLRRSYGLMRQSHPSLLSFGRPSFEKSLQVVSSPCCEWDLPDVILCESFLRCLVPCPGGTAGCTCLFLPLRHRPSPGVNGSAFSRDAPPNDFQADVNFGAADISLCSGLLVCSPPRSFPPLRAQPQGSRGFYVRAEHASLPPHASDILAVRIQAIDGARTFTPPDSQPCRPLLTPLTLASSGSFRADMLTAALWSALS
jgi:hypothetical protein